MSVSHENMHYLQPFKGCRIYASENHHTMRHLDYIGIVTEVSGNILYYRDRQDVIDCVIWKFKDGNNSTLIFGS